MQSSYRGWVAVGAIVGVLAVAAAAGSAHGSADAFTTAMARSSAAQMLGWHALAIIAVGFWGAQGGRLTHVAGTLFTGSASSCSARPSIRPPSAGPTWASPLPSAGHRPDARLARLRRWRFRPHPVIATAYLAADGYEQIRCPGARAGRAPASTPGMAASPCRPTRPSPPSGRSTSGSPRRKSPSPRSKPPPTRCGPSSATGPPTPSSYHRRMALIGDRLPPVKARPLRFPDPAPTSHLGAWTLLAPDRLLFSPTKTSPVPGGEWAVRGGPHRPTQPRLPQTMGSAHPHRPPPQARRHLPRSRCRPRRLDLGARPTRRRRHRRRQGSASTLPSRRSRPSPRCGRARSRWNRARSTGWSVTSSPIRPDWLALVSHWIETVAPAPDRLYQ